MGTLVKIDGFNKKPVKSLDLLVKLDNALRQPRFSHMELIWSRPSHGQYMLKNLNTGQYRLLELNYLMEMK